MQLDKDKIEDIQKRLKEISEDKSDFDIYKSFIISCKNSGVKIPAKIGNFIISDLEAQQK